MARVFADRASWQWPDDDASANAPGSQDDDSAALPDSPAESSAETAEDDSSPKIRSETKPRNGQSEQYMPRQCRICLETVYPTVSAPTSSIPTAFQPRPRVQYVSSDLTLGRLCKPCLCKGSSRYVHEGCLSQWRHTDPSYGSRNFYECPTCRFRYRLQRLAWGRLIGSWFSQLLLTITIMVIATFLIGFIADPIINLYTDPWAVVTSDGRTFIRQKNFISSRSRTRVVQLDGWMEHFLKGLAGMGLLGFVKVLWALGPSGWFNMRSTSLIGRARRAGTGRERGAGISWLVVIIGVGTFMFAVYKGVRIWSRRVLEKAGERVVDVQQDDEEDEESSDDVDNDKDGAAQESSSFNKAE